MDPVVRGFLLEKSPVPRSGCVRFVGPCESSRGWRLPSLPKSGPWLVVVVILSVAGVLVAAAAVAVAAAVLGLMRRRVHEIRFSTTPSRVGRTLGISCRNSSWHRPPITKRSPHRRSNSCAPLFREPPPRCFGRRRNRRGPPHERVTIGHELSSSGSSSECNPMVCSGVYQFTRQALYRGGGAAAGGWGCSPPPDWRLGGGGSRSFDRISRTIPSAEAQRSTTNCSWGRPGSHTRQRRGGPE